MFSPLPAFLIDALENATQPSTEPPYRELRLFPDPPPPGTRPVPQPEEQRGVAVIIEPEE